ncbi:MAG: cytochrome P450 [Sandaracinaceae bacterium]|nr:cytochrome P450 [Sandaracinaceae bacterium]MBK7153776.1 cytochrome P450 [Sandaracinaceae bacterium]MBK8408260.1 cytochrome P450 [Sandaracinaceae bacterium]MBP7683584.1 cytochrome P450 [Deltaproteobacteria bacterium]
MSLPVPSARLSRRRIRRAGLPTPWPEHPLRQLVAWASDMDGFLAKVRAGEAGAYTLDLWGHGLVAVFTSEEARRAVIQGSAEDFGHANDLAALFVGPSALLLLDGEKHAAARRRTMAVIAGDGIAAYGATMAGIADAWIDGLEVGGTTLALEGAQVMTLDVILQTVFGMQPSPEYDALHRLGREFMEGGRGTGGNLATMLLPAAVVRRLMLGRRGPDMELLKEPLPLRFLGRMRGVREARELVERLMEQIRVRRRKLDDGDTDALARILRHSDEGGVPLGDADLVDELLTLLLGGHETTAVVLGWLLYRLAGQPETWARARAELDEAFGDGPLDARRASRLPYLGAVVQESLRLDGLTLGVMRRTRREVVIDGYTIPAGTLVNAQVRHVHLDPARFDDPLAFRPERLLGGERLSPIDFAPFGGGYRRCVGAAFATFELSTLTAAIVRRVELRAPADLRVDRVQYGPFPGPSNAIPLEVLSRR